MTVRRETHMSTEIIFIHRGEFIEMVRKHLDSVGCPIPLGGLCSVQCHDEFQDGLRLEFSTFTKNPEQEFKDTP